MFRVEWSGKVFGKNQRLAKGKYGNFYLTPGYRGFKKGLTWQMILTRCQDPKWVEPFAGDVEVWIECHVHPRRDVDSVVPIIHDCLEAANIIYNDRQIAVTCSRKYRKDRGKPDRIVVEVKEAE